MSHPTISEKLSTPEPSCLPSPLAAAFSPPEGFGGLQAPAPKQGPTTLLIHNVEREISFVLIGLYTLMLARI